jgi:hypothetical protein
MLMSNPMDTGRLDVTEEYRAIDRAIHEAQHRDQIELRVGGAPRYKDLQSLLRRYRPDVVHYAGHASVNGIALVEDDGNVRLVPPAALEHLFAVVGRWVRCVVLNACLTEAQAEAISAHVPCVVGMSRSVLDEVAIEFSAGFYGAIGDGESIAVAFDSGVNWLIGHNLDARDPVLKARPGVAEQTVIVG